MFSSRNHRRSRSAKDRPDLPEPVTPDGGNDIHIRSADLFTTLVADGTISKENLTAARTEARSRNLSVASALISQRKISPSDLGRALTRFYDTPFVRFSPNARPVKNLLSGLKPAFLKANHWVPLKKENGHVIIAIDAPDDANMVDLIRSLFKNQSLELRVAIQEDIDQFIDLFFDQDENLGSIDRIISQLDDDLPQESNGSPHLVGEEDSVVVQLVNKIIVDADERRVSDIHIEPYSGRQKTVVRFRVDGQCYIYKTIPHSYRNAIISRLKIMSDLDIAERRKPQDGKIKFKRYGGRNIELRVATVPTQGGVEDVVLRILSAGEPLPLEKLGFSQRNLEQFKKMIAMPYGIILACGPTGSGKTTTLHSALAHINKPEIKIWTAEDPVEITQKGLRQVQVKPKIGFDFAAAMRSFLRADPDVIMVGEMRDQETAKIGIEASLTGHLVFSTLHTNSAPESVTRLLDMGMDAFNFADAILCILAQRLVRVLCPECKEPYHPDKTEYDQLVREYGVEAFSNNLGIPFSDDLTLYRRTGCHHCNNVGYFGRTAITELLMGTDTIKQQIQTHQRVDTIRRTAIAEGMTTLKQGGIVKIFDGVCDLIEVRKVTIR